MHDLAFSAMDTHIELLLLPFLSLLILDDFFLAYNHPRLQFAFRCSSSSDSEGDKGDMHSNSKNRLLKRQHPLVKVNLRSLFHSRVQTVIDAYPKSVDLSITIDPQLPEFIISDDVVLYQSTLNFLTNACKICEANTKGDCIELIVSKTVGASQFAWLRVECIDCGPGVEAEDLHQLFVPFSNINKSTLNGSGLGLYSVASHVKTMGGKYGCSRREDNKSGAVFWFTMPLTPFDEKLHGQRYDLDNAERRGFQSFRDSRLR